MPQGAYKFLESNSGDIDKLNDNYLDNLLSVDVNNAKAFCREKGIPLVSLQLIRFFYKHGIPFDSIENNERMIELEHKGRYGNQFARSTAKLVERIRDPDKPNRSTYGYEIYDLKDMFLAELESQDGSHPASKNSRQARDIREESAQGMIREFISNPTKFYPGLAYLQHPSIRSLSSDLPNGMLEGTKLFLFLYSQNFFPIEKTGEYESCESFNRIKNPAQYLFCKDSESYFNHRLRINDTGTKTSPDRTIFQKNGRAVLIQKTGGYKTNFDDRTGTTNATALNLEPIFVSGVLYPPGTLFAVVKKGDPKYVQNIGNQVYDSSEIQGLLPLRLSVYAITEGEQRKESFGTHYADFLDSLQNTNTPEGTIQMFKELAQQIIESQN